MPTTNVTANEARTIYASTGSPNTLRGRAAATNANVINTGNTGLLVSFFQHTLFNVYVNYRSFLNFDLSSLSGTVTGVSITLKRHDSLDYPDFFFVASEAGDSLALTDYLDGIVGASSYPFTSDATKFIDSAHSPDDGGSDGDTITINLNSAAVSHANSVIGSGKFKMAIINAHDFNDTYDDDDDGFGNALGVRGINFYSTDATAGSGHYPVLNVTTTVPVSRSMTFNLKSGKIDLKGGTLKLK
tara:strand:- start:313 stop:1044 length:732 start_codon:yes stop_codon:yes gene_type:complete